MANRNIFYNFCKYIEDEFPAELVFRNERIKISPAKSIPERNILVRDTGGVINPWSEWTVKSFQIITRDVDNPKAYELAQKLFDELHDRFGSILPADTVGGVVYPEIQISQISCTSMPQSIGSDERGLAEVSTNYKVIYNRDTEK